MLLIPAGFDPRVMYTLIVPLDRAINIFKKCDESRNDRGGVDLKYQISDLSFLCIEPASALSRLRSASECSSRGFSSWGKIRLSTIATKPESKTVARVNGLLRRDY